MKNVRVINRPFGKYKTIHVLCNLNNADYLEVTKYPDGDIMASMVLCHPDNDIILTVEQLEKLVEELKE